MATISRDSPCLFVTAVTHHRLPVFRSDALQAVACAALDEARTSGGFALFAYVIMPDHIHVITDGARKSSDTLRFIKGISSHRLIEYLKTHGHQKSLEKLRTQEKRRGHQYSLWEHHSDVVLLTTEAVFMQHVNYIHQNPVRADLVTRQVEYRWSSSRQWMSRPLKDEPLRVDVDQIVWRKAR